LPLPQWWIFLCWESANIHSARIPSPWRSLIADYTSRFITYEKDRLVALTGLAAELVFNLEGYNYTAGMWNTRRSIEYEHCWTVTARDVGEMPYRAKEYRAPSWSWAAAEDKSRGNHERDWNLTGDSQCSFVETMEIETTDGIVTGLVTSGRMHIRGPLLEHPQGLGISVDDPCDRDCADEKVYSLTMFELYAGSRVWGLALQRVEAGQNAG